MNKKFLGFSLLEVLVALAIIGIGALGFAKAQINALKSVTDTMTRTTANILVQDMVARIESNPGAAWDPRETGRFLSASGATSANCIGGLNTCTGDEMAEHDVADWKGLIDSSFPSNVEAVGVICLESTPGSYNFSSPESCANYSTTFPLVYTVKIYWKNTGSSGAYDRVEIGTVQPPLVRTVLYPVNEPTPVTAGSSAPILRGTENCVGTNCS